jgi:tetracycline repressor-like protein
MRFMWFLLCSPQWGSAEGALVRGRNRQPGVGDGNKEQFFGEVLTHELGIAIDAVPILGTGIDAIADYAGRVFDYQCAHPELARLTFWEGLKLKEPVAKDQRRSRSVAKVDRILAAVPELTREEAEDLLDSSPRMDPTLRSG